MLDLPPARTQDTTEMSSVIRAEQEGGLTDLQGRALKTQHKETQQRESDHFYLKDSFSTASVKL